MSIVSGNAILASDWNTHVRSFAKKKIVDVSVKDGWSDDTVSGSGSFWVRSAGWDWGTMYSSERTYTGILEDDTLAYEVGGRIIKYQAQTDDPDMPPASFVGTDWEIVRREYDGGETYLLGDEVVYGGGLFTVKVANVTGTPPILPVFSGTTLNTDTNYTRSHANNTYLKSYGSGMDNGMTIALQRPGVGAEIVIMSVDDLDFEAYLWLSPGKYSYTWILDESGVLPSFNYNYAYIHSQVYDDNVKQWAELRVLNSDQSNLASKGATKLTASAMNSVPLATDFDIDKKGGTSALYTGDW